MAVLEHRKNRTEHTRCLGESPGFLQKQRGMGRGGGGGDGEGGGGGGGGGGEGGGGEGDKTYLSG